MKHTDGQMTPLRVHFIDFVQSIHKEDDKVKIKLRLQPSLFLLLLLHNITYDIHATRDLLSCDAM